MIYLVIQSGVCPRKVYDVYKKACYNIFKKLTIINTPMSDEECSICYNDIS